MTKPNDGLEVMAHRRASLGVAHDYEVDVDCRDYGRGYRVGVFDGGKLDVGYIVLAWWGDDCAEVSAFVDCPSEADEVERRCECSPKVDDVIDEYRRQGRDAAAE